MSFMHYVQVIRVLYRVNGIASIGSVVSSNRSIGVSGGPQYGPTVGPKGIYKALIQVSSGLCPLLGSIEASIRSIDASNGYIDYRSL